MDLIGLAALHFTLKVYLTNFQKKDTEGQVFLDCYAISQDLVE